MYSHQGVLSWKLGVTEPFPQLQCGWSHAVCRVELRSTGLHSRTKQYGNVFVQYGLKCTRGFFLCIIGLCTLGFTVQK